MAMTPEQQAAFARLSKHSGARTPSASTSSNVWKQTGGGSWLSGNYGGKGSAAQSNGSTKAAAKSFNLGTAALNLMNAGGYSTANKVNSFVDGINLALGKNTAGTRRLKRSFQGKSPMEAAFTAAKQFEFGGLASATGQDIGQTKDNTYSHALKEMGANDRGAAVGGFVGDVALDPTTYFSLGGSALAKGAAKGLIAGARATKAGEKLTGVVGRTVERGKWAQKNPFIKGTRQALDPVVKAGAKGNMFENLAKGGALGAKKEFKDWRADNDLRFIAKQAAKTAKKAGLVQGAGTLGVLGATAAPDLARVAANSTQEGSEDAAVSAQAEAASRLAPDPKPEANAADDALDIASKQMDDDALPSLKPDSIALKETNDAEDAGGRALTNAAEDATPDIPATPAHPVDEVPSTGTVREQQAGKRGMFDEIKDMQTPSSVASIIKEGIVKNTPLLKDARIAKIEKNVTPFAETKLLSDLDTGVNGYSRLTKTWKNIKDKTPLTRVQAPYGAQVQGLARKRLKADALSPELRAALDEVNPARVGQTHYTGSDLLEFMHKATPGYVRAKEWFRARAIAEARQHVHNLVEKETPATAAGSREEQTTRWIATVAKQMGGNPKALEMATRLSKIDDPDKFDEALKSFTRETRQSGFKGFADFDKFLQKMDDKAAAQALGTDSHEGLKRLLAEIGIKSPYNEGVLSMVRKLKSRGREAYDETIRLSIENRKLLNDQAVPGGLQIENLAHTFDVDAGLAGARQAASEAIDGTDEVGRSVFSIAARDALVRTVEKWKTLGKKAEFTTKSGGLARGIQGEANSYVTQGWNQQATYTFYASAMREISKAADAAGIKDATKRAAFFDEKMMEQLGLMDSFLRANGTVPTTTMTRAEANARKLPMEKAEYAFLSPHDVLSALSPDLRQAMLFYGKNLNLPITAITNAARQAIKRGELMKTVEDVAKHQKEMFLKDRATLESSFTKGGGEAFQNTVDAVIRTLNDPEVVQTLTKTHIANGVFARASLGMVTDEITAEGRQHLEDVLASGVSIGEKFAEIDKAGPEMDRIVREAGLDDTQVDSLAQMEQSVSLARAMSTADFYAYRAARATRLAGRVNADGSAATAENMARAREAVNELTSRTNGKGERIEPPKRGTESPRQAAERSNNIHAASETYDDVAESVEAAALKAMAEVPEDFQDPYTYAMIRSDMAQQASRNTRLANGFLDMFSAEHGQSDTRMLSVLEQFTPRAMNSRFDESLAAITKTHGREAINAAFKLFQQMPESTLDEAFVGYRTAVAAAAKAGEKLDRSVLNADEGIQAFQKAISDLGMDVNALPAGTIDAARDLLPAHQIVFGGGEYNLIGRAGADPKYINGHLLRAGMPSTGEGGWVFPENANGSDLWDAWRHANMESMDAVDMLRRTHAALQQATMVPAIATDFSKQFSHTALGYATEKEAYADGFRRINFKDAETNNMLRFVDPKGLYHPDMLRQLQKSSDALSKINDPAAAGILERALAKMDPVMNAVKSSLTIWRPGHWVANILGEGWMNMIAGVNNPMTYKKALDIMVTKGRVGKYDPETFAQYLEHAPVGKVAKFDADAPHVVMAINGKAFPVSYDTIYAMAEKRGVILHHNQAEDLFVDANSPYKRRFGMISDMNEKLGKGSAARDTIFRLTHFIHELEQHGGRNIEEMADRAAGLVHKYHPSMQTLTAGEQGLMRRLVYFYTWQKQALTRIIQGALDTPGRMLIPQKMLYNLGVYNGLDPESVGNPVDRDALLPSYLQNSLTGTQFKAGYNPLGQGSMLWGLQLSNPTTDIMTNLTSDLNYDPSKTAGENVVGDATSFASTNGANMISPVLTTPYNLAKQEDSFGRDLGGDPKKNLQYLMDQTGLQYPSRVTGQLLPGVDRTDVKKNPDGSINQEQQSGNEVRYALNWLTGAKVNNFQSDSYMDRARSEQGQAEKSKQVAALKAQGYSDADIAVLTK